MSLSRLLFLFTLVVFILFNKHADCGRHASIKSQYGQLVTSSTLQWKQVTQWDVKRKVPEDSVPSGKGNKEQVICRAEHHGTLLVGQTILSGSCEVAFVNKIFKKQKFEVLINVQQAAKLEWQSYAKFTAVPKGAVAAVDTSDDIYVGRYLDSAKGYLPGGIEVNMASYSFGSMAVFDGQGAVKEVSYGEVMVEVEPNKYELQIHHNPNSRPKIIRNDVVLSTSSLFRFDEGRDLEARLQKVISYDYDTSEYYGQVPGMIRALPATVSLSDGQTHSILWGLPQVSKHEETLMVGHPLRHQSAVDVSIVGVKITEEVAYRGTLTSIFPGGARREREVEGLIQKKYLTNIRPEYSRVYKIKDSVVVSATPTTVPTTPMNNHYNHNSINNNNNNHYHSDWTATTDREKSWLNKDNNERDLMFSDQTKNNKNSDKNKTEKSSQSFAVISQSCSSQTQQLSLVPLTLSSLLIVCFRSIF